MRKFGSYEEISASYPINGKANQIWYAEKRSINVLTKTDLEYCKLNHPNGYLNKVEHRWYYWNIFNEFWYDCYIFDGESWTLGVNSWDGIINPKEVIYEIFQRGGVEWGSFRTYEEALEWTRTKTKQRMEF